MIAAIPQLRGHEDQHDDDQIGGEQHPGAEQRLGVEGAEDGLGTKDHDRPGNPFAWLLDRGDACRVLVARIAQIECHRPATRERRPQGEVVFGLVDEILRKVSAVLEMKQDVADAIHHREPEALGENRRVERMRIGAHDEHRRLLRQCRIVRGGNRKLVLVRGPGAEHLDRELARRAAVGSLIRHICPACASLKYWRSPNDALVTMCGTPSVRGAPVWGANQHRG